MQPTNDWENWFATRIITGIITHYITGRIFSNDKVGYSQAPLFLSLNPTAVHPSGVQFMAVPYALFRDESTLSPWQVCKTSAALIAG